MKPLRVAILTTDKRDHDRDYTKPVPEFGTAPEALLQGFARLPEVEIHVVSCVHQPLVSPEKIAPNIFYHSLVVPKLGWMRSLYFGCRRTARKKLREMSPDLVHGQGTELDCALNAVRSGFPNVLTIHGNMRLVAKVNRARPFSFLWLAARLEEFTLPRTDGVVCISRYTHDAVKLRAPRTWVLPNAVDENFFRIEAVPDAAQPPVGLCVGTVCPRKNQNEFIRALDGLAAHRRFKIIFLGAVAPDDYGREFLRLVGERAWCEYAGFADREALKKHFLRASFLALPTREDNCPMTVLEAMAAGVPVMASQVGGVPDLIEEGRTGLFCDPHQPQSFGAALERLLENPAFARQLAANAKTAAHSRFHPQVVAQRHLEIYREVLAGRRS